MRSVRFLSILATALSCIISVEANSFAQDNRVLPEAEDSVVVYPLRSFDFGTLNPSADASKQVALTEDEIVSKIKASKRVSEPGGAKDAPTIGDDEDYAVGEIPYGEDITPIGGGLYTVPIMASPISKFPPRISIQYNSQSGNGDAGYGWNVAGLSSITLINKNLYYHNAVAPALVSDNSGVYALDGIPLVSNEHSGLVSEYQLETAKGHILVKKHLSGTTVSHFTVLYPDGSRATYGSLDNTTARFEYPITLWEDKLGNQIVYNYNLIGSYYIHSITYKHKNNSDQIGRIQFNYTYRTDSYVYYHAGESTGMPQILKSVSTYSQNELLCAYHLTHEIVDGVSQLKSIGCTNASGEELRPLSFTYGDSSNLHPTYLTPDFQNKDNLFLHSYFSSDSVEIGYLRGKFLCNNYGDGLIAYPQFATYDVVVRKKQERYGGKNSTTSMAAHTVQARSFY